MISRARRFLLLFGIAIAPILSSAAPVRAWAETERGNLELVTPPEAKRPREVIAPAEPYKVTRPREADFRPDNIRTQHDPRFIPPFSRTVSTGSGSAVRLGFSGWTAPPGQGDRLLAREDAGLFALGFSIVWPSAPRQP